MIKNHAKAKDYLKQMCQIWINLNNRAPIVYYELQDLKWLPIDKTISQYIKSKFFVEAIELG